MLTVTEDEKATPPDRSTNVRFEDLSELPEDSLIPFLDRTHVDLASLTPTQRSWREEGVVVLPRMIPDELIHAYCRQREGRLPHDQGFQNCYAYLSLPSIRDISLYKPVTDVIESLFGEKLCLHFDLTQWVSTERNWHQDDYLNSSTINAWYAAVWFALDDIHPDCGPFEYVPGSHRWPVVRRDLVKSYMSPEDAKSPRWPSLSESILTRVYERKLQESGLPKRRFIARKGDVLIWHGRLLHRGTRANTPGMVRKSLISHYTGISKLQPECHDLGWSEWGAPYIIHKDVVPFAWPPAEESAAA